MEWDQIYTFKFYITKSIFSVCQLDSLQVFQRNCIDNVPHSSSQPSPTWKGLSKNLSLIRTHLWWQINSGQQVSLHSPFWWNASSGNHNLKVHDLLDTSASSWNQDQVNQLFPLEAQHHILSTPFALDGTPDRLIWKLSPDGTYSVSLGYHLLLTTQEAFSTSVDFNHRVDWIWLWKLPIPPKYTMFLWRLLHGAVPSSCPAALLFLFC